MQYLLHDLLKLSLAERLDLIEQTISPACPYPVGEEQSHSAFERICRKLRAIERAETKRSDPPRC